MQSVRFWCGWSLFLVLAALGARRLEAETVVHVKPDVPYQTIDGFGVFGGYYKDWSNHASTELADRLVNDLGITIVRSAVPFDFEKTDLSAKGEDKDLSKYNLSGDVAQWVAIWKAYHAKGVNKFIFSVWSPPVWMKNPGNHGHQQPWCQDGRAGGRLLPENYGKFAQMLVMFLKYFKQQVGVDAYAISLQNELSFDEPYESCIYSPAEYVALLKVVGKKFREEKVATKIFYPEDIGWYDRVMSYINAVLNDPEARQYASIVAIHAYATDGVTPASPDAKTWENMQAPGAKYHLPFWMTETSGYDLRWDGAMKLGRAMYIALKYGKISAWVYWQASNGPGPDNSALTGGTDGKKAPPKYYVAKQFYRYVRPGSVSVDASTDDNDVLPLAFSNAADQNLTLVIINNSKAEKTIKLDVAGKAPASYKLFRSSATENCAAAGQVQATENVKLPPLSITTLQGSR